MRAVSQSEPNRRRDSTRSGTTSRRPNVASLAKSTRAQGLWWSPSWCSCCWVVRAAAHRRRARAGMCCSATRRRRQGGNRAAVAGVQLAGAGVRCRLLDAGAADPALGAGLDRVGRFGGGRAAGLLAVWSRQTVASRTPRSRHRADHRLDRRHRADVPLGARGVVAHRSCSSPPRRSAVGPPRTSASPDLLETLDDPDRAEPPKTRRDSAGLPASACGSAPRPPRRPTAATVRRWPWPPRRPWCVPPPRPSAACRSNCSARSRNWSARACACGSTGRLGGVAHLLLDGAQSTLEVGRPLARHLADRVPLVADRPQARPAPLRGRWCRASPPRPAAPPWRWRSRRTRRPARRSTALRAVKKVSWAALNRCHRASSTSGPRARRPSTRRAGRGTRRWSRPSRWSRTSSSARSHSCSLACRAPARSRSRSAKCDPRRRLNVSRAAE